jgi:malto-oligosyltrehalose synthase
VARFQQLSAPVAAKSVEDTAFYRYGRLLSRNDVGFDVHRFSDSATDFHAHALRRHGTFPHAMLATATHDHKRGEDVRARLAVLSEYAERWAAVLPGWIGGCRKLAGGNALSGGDIAMLLQMIVGAWPLDLDPADANGRRAFAERLAQWQEKALREAKLATDWTVPNEPYEKAARDLTTSLVATNAGTALLREIEHFAQRISAAGAVNGLAQTLLKLTAPGVPDIYQGTEFWDFSLVDPDNRRPVDFAARAAALRDTPLAELATRWRDGRIKQALLARTLTLRRERPQLFAGGSYTPLDVRGAFAERVVAFARRLGDASVITVVPRTASRLLRNNEIAFAPGAWKDTSLALPHTGELVNVLTDARLPATEAPIPLDAVLTEVPVALLASLHRT